MADDFDPLTVPAVMPRSVRRVDPATGLPSKYLLDWEEGSQAWMKANVANTNTRLNLVSAEVDGAYAAIATEATTRANADEALATLITTVEARVSDNEAAIVTESTARATEDSALAAQITTVDAKVDDISANGEIYFAATTTPVGATASFGIYLTAGSSFTGFEMLALSGGGSAIAFSASQFMLKDSGTAQNVFNYSGGVFTFNVPVVIDHTEIADNAVTRAWASSGTTYADVTADYRGSGFLEIYIGYNGDPAVYNAIDQFILRLTDWTSGTVVGSIPITQSQNGTGSSSACRYGATNTIFIQSPATGTRTYLAEIVKTTGGSLLMLSGVTLVVKEFSK